jgi:branched-chain amino acid transport system permease protein
LPVATNEAGTSVIEGVNARLRAHSVDPGRVSAFLVMPVIALVLRQLWNVPWGVVVQGLIIGGLTALVALGIALVYRANRIINFAQGDLGAVPATLAVLLIMSLGVPYVVGFATGLVAAIVLGVLVETLIIRRFFRAPRLILTVATIGLAQVLAACGLLLPNLFDSSTFAPRLEPPFHLTFTVNPIRFEATDILTLLVVPIAFVALALFLRRSSVGIAIRAAAERADRASTLGIPVKRLHTVVWVVATVLAFVAMFLRAGVVGPQIGSVLGPGILLRVLAAAVIGRMERFPTIAAAALGLGIVEQDIFWHWHEASYIDPALFIVILGALLLIRQSRRTSRIDSDETSTWQAAREVRPVPRELVRLPEVRYARWGLGLALCAFLLTLPAWLDQSRVNLAAAIVIFGIIGLSLVVLTGWAGQVSLGQMAFVGIGAAVGGSLTSRLGWDLSIALLVAGLVGAVVAVIIGFPAIRRGGLTLAVMTLAFALAASSYFLNRQFFSDWLPALRIDRPPIFGSVDVASETRFYYLTLACLVIALAMVRGVRRSRTGRVLIGIRENERAARAFGVDATRTKLAAFAFSGFLAAFAGALFVHHQTGLGTAPYAPEESLTVFTMVVIGGLGSVPGALLGATYVRGVDWFVPSDYRFLATGAGLLLVLMIAPGGLGAVMYDVRDWYLRKVAHRRGVIVPSLVADTRQPEPVPRAAQADAAAEAEEAADAVSQGLHT